MAIKKYVLGIVAVVGLCVLSAGPTIAETATMDKATLAAGCFWGVEKIFAELPGVISTQVGYTGGHMKNPTYHDICETDTGHAEALEITFDPAMISYEALLIHFFSYHDPTTIDRQGPDIGSQYRSAIYYHTPQQKTAADKSVVLLNKEKVFRQPVVTQVVAAETFYRAEEYHQKYLKKNPNGYCSIHFQTDRVEKALRGKL